MKTFLIKLNLLKESGLTYIPFLLYNCGICIPALVISFDVKAAGRFLLTFFHSGYHYSQLFNPLPVQFKALLHGQKGCVFFSGHLNLCTTPETGLPSREKNHNN